VLRVFNQLLCDASYRVIGILPGGRQDLAPPPGLRWREGQRVTVKARREFYVAGKLVKRGERVDVDEWTARDLAVLGRAEIVT
jgi:hypothetical protein